jgi:sec-independent protein translocase protein TatA
MGNIGAPEIIVVLVLALLIFGPNRLPQLGRQIGRAMREFRQATNDLKADFDLALDEDEESKPAAAGAPAVIDLHPASEQPDLSGFAETLPAAIAAKGVEGSDGETAAAAAPAEAAAPADEAPPATAGGS